MSAAKVHSLVALALGTDREEEARTSAILALRLMKKEGLTIGGAPAPAFDELRIRLTEAARWAEKIAMMQAELTRERAARAAAERDAATAREGARKPREKVQIPVPPASRARTRTRGYAKRGSSARAEIVAKYAGTCRECRDPFEEGEPIAWSRERGAVCLGCHRRAA